MQSPEGTQPQGEKPGFSFGNWLKGFTQEGRHEAMASDAARAQLQEKRDKWAGQHEAIEGSHRDKLEEVKAKADTGEMAAVVPEHLDEIASREQAQNTLPTAEHRDAA